MNATARIRNLAESAAQSARTGSKITFEIETAGPYLPAKRDNGCRYVVRLRQRVQPWPESHPDRSYPLCAEFDCRTRNGMHRLAAQIRRAMAAAV